MAFRLFPRPCRLGSFCFVSGFFLNSLSLKIDKFCRNLHEINGAQYSKKSRKEMTVHNLIPFWSLQLKQTGSDSCLTHIFPKSLISLRSSTRNFLSRSLPFSLCLNFLCLRLTLSVTSKNRLGVLPFLPLRRSQFQSSAVRQGSRQYLHCLRLLKPYFSDFCLFLLLLFFCFFGIKV